MSPNFRIAVRFLLSKKRSMLMSLAGIVLGVGLFIVAQANTTGFEKLFIKTVLGANGAVRVQDKFQETLTSIQIEQEDTGRQFEFGRASGRKYRPGVEHADKVIESLYQFSNVLAASKVLRGAIDVSNNFKAEPAQLFGIEKDMHMLVSDLEEQIVFGSMLDFQRNPRGALVGLALAERMMIEPGDSILFTVGDESHRVLVSGIYETGYRDIDRERIFIDINQARRILKRPHQTSYIQVSLFDVEKADDDRYLMESVVQHIVAPWQEREKVWLQVFQAVRISAMISLSSIIFISGLGMFSTLAIIIMEKTREIAILRSIGYTRRDVTHIFIWQGFIVTVVGILMGWLTGATLTLVASRLPIRIRGIFSTDSFVVDWSIWHYVIAGLIAFIFVMTASIIPSRRAAKLEPGDVIRGTSG
ncbi:MAG: ABC transporter permease [Opitutales bacterium]|nr:ABC transporter permease [Opitutales bacterium]